MTIYKKRTMINSVLLLLIILGFKSNTYSQNTTVNTEMQTKNKTISLTDAEKDWKHLNYMKNVLMVNLSPEEKANYEKLNLFEYLQFEDKLKLHRSRLAEAFLDTYPNDPNYDKALTLFLNPAFRPLFISKAMTDEHIRFLSGLKRNLTSDWFLAYRTLPIDKVAKGRWLKKGNEYVYNILDSNTSLDRKALVSMGLISRDYMLASLWYDSLNKESREADYWEYFDTYYWEAFRQRLYNLMDNYPDSKSLAKYIQSFLDDLKRRAPILVKKYAKSFYLNTGDGNPMSNRKGIKALHETLSKNLKAEDALKHSPDTKPIKMSFTALDGTRVNLANMHGKVVLIDFWSTWCPPCIKEMPHLKVLYDKYKDDGFEIIGIAANSDNNKDQVLKILKKTKANWPQRLDKGKDATVSYHALYKIKSLPTVWLLDREGKVVDWNARGNRLEPLIRKHLGLDN